MRSSSTTSAFHSGTSGPIRYRNGVPSKSTARSASIGSVRSTRFFFGRGQTQPDSRERSLNTSRAFLSRSRREHDYLLGRLDAAERLIDIVSDAAAMEGALGKTDIRVLKRDAFRAILDTEEHHLQDKDLIAQMKSEVSKL